MANTSITELCRHLDGVYYCDSISQSVLDFTLPDTSLVVFKHDLKGAVICDSGRFQVHVWGSDKYTIWELPSGTHTCLFLREVYIDACGDFYVVSRKPHACREVDLAPCEQELSRLLAQLNSTLFLLSDVEIHQELINTHKRESSVDKCLEKLKVIESVVREKKNFEVGTSST